MWEQCTVDCHKCAYLDISVCLCVCVRVLVVRDCAADGHAAAQHDMVVYTCVYVCMYTPLQVLCSLGMVPASPATVMPSPPDYLSVMLDGMVVGSVAASQAPSLVER